MNTHDEAKKIVEQLRNIALTSTGGKKLAKAESERQGALFFSLRQAIGAGLAYGEAQVVEGWFDIYFSPRKYKAYNGGLELVRSEILRSLNKIDSILNWPDPHEKA